MKIWWPEPGPGLPATWTGGLHGWRKVVRLAATVVALGFMTIPLTVAALWVLWSVSLGAIELLSWLF